MSQQSLKTKLDAVTSNAALRDDALAVVGDVLDKVNAFAAAAEEYRAASKDRRARPVPADDELAATPADVVAAIDGVQTAIRTLLFDLGDLSTYIRSLVPELKEEDNAGVAIQKHVLETISAYSAALTGQAKEQPAALVHLGAKYDYLKARADLENQLKPSGKDASVPASESLRRAIHELDNLTLGNVALTYADLRRRCVTIGSMVARNLSKIEKPRRDGGGMIG